MTNPSGHAGTVGDSASPQGEGDTGGEVSLKAAWRALYALLVGFFMILLDQTIVAVATPQFQEQLGASLNAVVWVTSIYLFTFAVPLLVTGRLGDRYGQRNMYLVGMAIFTLSSLACGLAPNIEMLILARAVQGFGASILTPQTMSVINRLFPYHKRGAAMGVWGMVAGLASLAGPLLGGLIVGTVGWEWIFFINVPLGVLSLVLVSKWVPKLPRTSRSLDLASVVVSVVAVFCLVFAIQQGPEVGMPWWIYALGALGVVLLVVFVRLQASAETRGNDALVPLDLFRIRNFSLGSFSIATIGFAIGGTMLPIMMYFQEVHGLSAEKSGMMLIPMAVISGALSPVSGRLADKFHPRLLSMFGFGMMTLAMLLFFLVMRDGISVWWMLLPISIQGVASGFVWSPNSMTAMRDISLNKVGAASGVYNTTRQVGSVLGAAVIGAAMQVGVSLYGFSGAMGHAMIAPTVVLLAGFVAVSQFTDKREKVGSSVG